MAALLRKYGVAATINFELFEIDGVDLRVDAVAVTGDTKIMKDEGDEGDTTNNFTDEGQGYALLLDSTEMTAARIVIYVVDAATKVWLDRTIVIETYGNAAAQHEFDLDTFSTAQTGDSFARLGVAGVGLTDLGGMSTGMQDEVNAECDTAISDGKLMRSLASGVADSGTSTTLVDAARTEADTNYWTGCWLVMTSGNISGQARKITDFTPASDTITVERAFTQAVATQTYEIWPADFPDMFSLMAIATDGAVDSDVRKWLGTVAATPTVAGVPEVDITHVVGAVINALVAGRMDSSVGAMEANTLNEAAIAVNAFTAAKIAANAITAAKIATDAITAAKIATATIINTTFAAGAIDAAAFNADTVDKIRDGLLPTQNATFDNIMFLFVAASDHVTPVTGATSLAVTRSIDGGAFGSGTGTLAEIGNGIYQYDASAADMNGGKIMFRFTATGGTPGAPDDRFVSVVTGGGV